MVVKESSFFTLVEKLLVIWIECLGQLENVLSVLLLNLVNNFELNLHVVLRLQPMQVCHSSDTGGVIFMYCYEACKVIILAARLQRDIGSEFLKGHLIVTCLHLCFEIGDEGFLLDFVAEEAIQDSVRISIDVYKLDTT